VSKPHQGVRTLTGYARLIFAANSLEKLFGSDDATREADVVAMEERVLIIHAPAVGRGQVHPACVFLKSLGAGVDHIFERGLAEHVLWLRDNRKPARTRFGVSADGDARSALLLHRPAQQRVLDWIGAFLMQGVFPFPALAFDGTRVLAQSTLVHTNWSLYDNTKKGIGPRELQIALASLSLGAVLTTIAGKRHRFQKLDMDLFSTWAADAGLEDQLAEALVALQAKYPVKVDDL
jgi:hypothetical protein